MTESFNPYRKWLGIPEQDQPPNHYRLLGIELLESDADVISNAADGRMAQLKNYQTGKYSQFSQRILNEIASAKVCLLNPAKKAEYDRQLKQQGEEKNSRDEPAGAAAAADAILPEFPRVSALSAASRTHRRQSPWQIPLVLAGASVLLIAVLVFWNHRETDGPATEHARASSPDRPDAASPKPPRTPPEKAKPKEPETVGPPAKPAPSPEKKPEITEEPAENPVEKPPVKPIEEPSVEPEQLAPEPEEPAAESRKMPVPSEAEQQAAEAKIREIFGQELVGTKTADEKLAVAAKLLKQGRASSNEPAVRFVLLRMAGEWIAGTGELKNALDVVDAMREDFDVDALSMKADLAAKAVEANRSGDEATLKRIPAMIDAANTLIDEAIEADDFETAGRVGRLAVGAARSAKNPQLIRDATARSRDVDRLKLKYASIKKAIDALAGDPADAAANQTVGQWQCFSKGDWAKGLPFLRKGADEKLANLAEQDLANPTDAKSQTALADGWWEAAESEQGPAKTVAQTRAAHWYEEALPRLTAIDKLKVEKRLESFAAARETENQHAAPSLSRRGAVQPGNVALASNGTMVSGVQGGAIFLFDGRTKENLSTDYAVSRWPCEWMIGFQKTYLLQAIRFYLSDVDKNRFYRYRIQISSDGKRFVDLVDRSQGEWRGWQLVTFPPRPVRAIKLIGLYNSANPRFHVVEFEAYCILPKQ